MGNGWRLSVANSGVSYLRHEANSLILFLPTFNPYGVIKTGFIGRAKFVLLGAG